MNARPLTELPAKDVSQDIIETIGTIGDEFLIKDSSLQEEMTMVMARTGIFGFARGPETLLGENNGDLPEAKD